MHFISLGAGVQSSTLALMAAHGEVTPRPAAAIFADTQAEPYHVYDWLNWLKTQLPFPVVECTKGSLVEAMLAVHLDKSGAPYIAGTVPAHIKQDAGGRSMLHRQCTQTYKIEVVQSAVRKIAGIKRGQKTVVVTQWIGISLDEAHRMKPSREPWLESRWPLIERRMTREDCLAWMQEHGYPTPPRSACVFCPYNSRARWRELKRDYPAEFVRAVEIERLYQSRIAPLGQLTGVPYFHRDCVPLDQAVQLDPAECEAGEPSGFGNECEGMCGV